MTDWEEYAKARQDQYAFDSEPVQATRVKQVIERLVGTVLDVAGGDGWPTAQYRDAGFDARLLDISPTRVARAERSGVPAEVGDATALPYDDASFDTIVLGEILEHLDNPGPVVTEAFRVAKERVIITLPLRGWADPTHQWRVSLDVCVDPIQSENEETKGSQIVLTFQRGPCWPPDYWRTDETWSSQFGEPYTHE